MTENVFCTVAQREQADAAIARMQLLGFEPEKIIESSTHAEDNSARSTIVGVALGFAVGFLLGVSQLAYYGDGVWLTWDAALLPIFGGLGWALVGSIVGCSGLLASRKVPHRINLVIPLHDDKEKSLVCATLSSLGASDIYFSEDAA